MHTRTCSKCSTLLWAQYTRTCIDITVNLNSKSTTHILYMYEQYPVQPSKWLPISSTTNTTALSVHNKWNSSRAIQAPLYTNTTTLQLWTGGTIWTQWLSVQNTYTYAEYKHLCTQTQSNARLLITAALSTFVVFNPLKQTLLLCTGGINYMNNYLYVQIPTLMPSKLFPTFQAYTATLLRRKRNSSIV